MPSAASPDPTPRDQPLLPRVAAGDGAALGAVVERYRGLVWSLARRLGVRPADADDAVQEVVMDLWKSAGRFDPAIASEKTFVATIARRRLIDRQRRAGRRPEDAELPAAEVLASDADRRIEAGVEASLAGRAIARLRPEERRAVLLNVYHGWSQPDRRPHRVTAGHGQDPRPARADPGARAARKGGGAAGAAGRGERSVARPSGGPSGAGLDGHSWRSATTGSTAAARRAGR